MKFIKILGWIVLVLALILVLSLIYLKYAFRADETIFKFL